MKWRIGRGAQKMTRRKIPLGLCKAQDFLASQTEAGRIDYFLAGKRASVIEGRVMKRLNWQILVGFLLTLFAFLSYPFIFIEWPITRDFPWVNLLLFVVALVFLFIGVRRAFKPGRRLVSKIVAPLLATLSVLILALFIFIAFIQSRWLPASQGAPQVGQRMADFTLADTNNSDVTLASLLSQPINNKPPKGVLLIFYRGYW
jgi:hypothetical protein